MELQHIKNFRAVEPTEEQMAQDAASGLTNVLYLQSEDGQDWYECQSLFADDTIKVAYDATDGRIASVVDKPVPERGNIYAVSMFFPVDMSVVEITQAAWPQDFNLDDDWIFDGVNVVKRETTPAQYRAAAVQKKQRLLQGAAIAINPLQDAVDLGIATDEETSQLMAWKQYRVALNRVDTSLAPDIEWPPEPVNSDK